MAMAWITIARLLASLFLACAVVAALQDEWRTCSFIMLLAIILRDVQGD
jgi:hypothetical protein